MPRWQDASERPWRSAGNCSCSTGTSAILGGRSEASGKVSPFFRHFEAHSGDYVTKNSPGANFRVSPEGVKRMDALNENGGIRGRFLIAAVEST